MKSKKTLLMMGGGIFLLSACAGQNLDRVAMMAPEGTAFQKAVHKEYVALASDELDEADYVDADFFAARAGVAAGGKEFDPQNVTDRRLPDNTVGSISGARVRLLRALTPVNKTTKPGDSARALAMFECWIQEQEENNQPSHIERCRSEFDKAMANLEVAVAAPAPMPAPAAPEPLPGPFTVYFDFNSSSINSTAQDVIAKIGLANTEAGPKEVLVTGHTDRAGGDDYNAKLSAARAAAVAAALQRVGVGQSKIKASSRGESQPWIGTPDGQKSSLNRRVEVRFR